jgi:hypothetical protein
MIPANMDAAVEGVNDRSTGMAGGAIEYGHFSLIVRVDGI